MGDCKIIFNEKGEKTGVFEIGTNVPSQTFQDILNNVHTTNFDEALKIYSNLYSKDIKFSIIGEKGASQIEEYQKSLEEAKKLDKQGIDKFEVEKQTGWYKNEQNQWKYFSNEFIDQFKIKDFEVNKEYNYLDIIEDSIVSKMYPQVENLKIIFYDESNTYAIEKTKNADGLLDYRGGGNATLYVRANNTYGRDTKSIFAHELTHYIQTIEDFARGGSKDSIILKAFNILKADKLSNDEFVEKLNNYDTNTLNSGDKSVIESVKRLFNNKSTLTKEYLLLQGEKDARAVELALKLENKDYTYKELLDELQNEEGLDITQAISIFRYNQAYSITKTEPSLKYQTQEGNIFTSFAQALRSTNGGDIKVGVNTVKGFKELYSIDSNTNVDTQAGLINHLIKAEILSDRSYKENGLTHLISEGKSYVKKLINGEAVKDAFKKQLGAKSAKLKKDGSVQINQDSQKDKVTVINKKGESVVVDMAELNAPFEELKKKFDSTTIAIAFANSVVNKEANKTSELINEDFVSENELQDKLIALIKKLGITTMAFDDYIKRFPLRNGMPIDAQALADITERIIAFKDGIVDSDDLVEEVAHLIEASMSFEQKENILRNIHKTKEWGEFAKQYEGIYETDLELRREILGKVIANSIKEQFAQRDSNQTENSIIAKIKQFFEEFINNIRKYFQESYVTELDNINKSIFDKLFSETLELDLEGQSGVYFSSKQASFDSKRAVKITQDSLEAIRLQQSKLNKKYKNSSDKAYLEQSQKLITLEEDAYILDGIAKFARLVSSQTNRLVSASEKKQSGEFPLSAEENTIYQNLRNNVRGAVLELNSILSDKDITQKKIKDDLNRTVENLNALETTIKRNTPLAVDRIVEDFLNRYDMYDDKGELTKEGVEYKELIKSAVEGKLKDTNIIHTVLGSMAQAHNPLLGIAGNIIKRMQQQQNDDFQKSWKTFINKITSLKGTQADFEKLIDKETNSLISETDPKLVTQYIDDLKKQIEADIINSRGLTGFKTLEEYYESEKDEVEVDFVKDIYQKSLNVKLLERLEPYYEESYSKERAEHKFTINNVVREPIAVALQRDKEYKSQIGEIRKNAVNDELTKEDNFRIKEISLRRAEEENPRDTTTGEFIKGVTEVYDRDKKRYFVVRSNTKGLSPQDEERASIIVGLNTIRYKNQDFLSGRTGKDIPQKFLDSLAKLQTVEEKLEFVKNNAYLSYSDDYFDKLNEKDSLLDKLRKEGTDEADGLIEEIRAQKSIIENIKKANAIKNEPGEVDFLQITETQKNSIKLAQSILDAKYKKAKSLLKEDKSETIDAVTRVTDAYEAHLIDAEIDTVDKEVDFILLNTTGENATKIGEARQMAEGSRAISKGFSKLFTEGMNKEERQETLRQYARTKLLPHLKKTEPLNYTEAYNQVLSGKLSVEDWIQGNTVKVVPSFSFYELGANINPVWQENKKNKREQWKPEYVNKVKDARFDAIQKDSKLKGIRDAILEYNDSQIENVNLTGVQSRYQMPFIRRTLTQRAMSLTADGLKETFKEAITFRAEEQELMPELNNGLYTIPVYYNKPLDDPREQSTDYIYNLALWGQTATQHKYRRENISDMLVIEETLKDVRHNSANAYKMFNSFMEYNFYGKQESFSYKVGNVDLGKVLKVVNNFAKKYNIAGITVPITSALQATVAKNMERLIGETIDTTSSNIGNSLFAKFASSSARESMGFASNSIPNVVGEAFGLYSIVHRYENSQLGKGGRLLVNLSGKLHEMGNFPVVQRAMFGIIASYRYVDGKLLHYSKFVQKLEAQGFKGDVKAEWQKQELFIDDFLLAVENGVLDFNNPKFINAVKSKLTGVKPEELEKYLYDKKLDIGTRVGSFINRIDSQIPNDERNILQRNAIGNFFFSHLGWLSSAIQRRVKQRHFNQSEDGIAQEGTWRTAAQFVGKLVKAPKDFAKIYAELDFGQKKNLRRVMVEVGYANALALLGLLLAGMDDDDDDRFFGLAMADYFTNRVAVEQISSTLGLPTSIYSVTDQPLMLARKIKDWSKVSKLGGSSEDRFKYLGSFNGFLRDYTKYEDLTKARQTYMHFNDTKKGLYDIYAPLTLLMNKNE